ncbi:hypothetical protein D3C84_874730 [compost metagenome]
MIPYPGFARIDVVRPFVAVKTGKVLRHQALIVHRFVDSQCFLHRFYFEKLRNNLVADLLKHSTVRHNVIRSKYYIRIDKILPERIRFSNTILLHRPQYI